MGTRNSNPNNQPDHLRELLAESCRQLVALFEAMRDASQCDDNPIQKQDFDFFEKYRIRAVKWIGWYDDSAVKESEIATLKAKLAELEEDVATVDAD